MSNFAAISWWERDENDVRFILDEHTELNLYSANSLKQHSMGRHVAQLGHIILVLNQPVFALTPKCCMLGREVTNLVLGLTRLELKPMTYHTSGEYANHYTTNAFYGSPESESDRKVSGIHITDYQGCGNTEMFYLSPGKSSEKSYLSGQNPTCPAFCTNIWYL